jgi:hypothetical protein
MKSRAKKAQKSSLPSLENRMALATDMFDSRRDVMQIVSNGFKFKIQFYTLKTQIVSNGFNFKIQFYTLKKQIVSNGFNFKMHFHTLKNANRFK